MSHRRAFMAIIFGTVAVALDPHSVAAATGPLGASRARADDLRIGPIRTIVSAARLRALRLPIFPDGSIFAFQFGRSRGFFAAQGGVRTATDVGSIELDAAFAPAWTDAQGAPIASLRPGFLQPAPDGNAGGFPIGASFDRDYAGGGPTYFDRPTGAVLQLYHGEYHPLYPLGQPFYSSIGMAISADGGRTFRKLGLVLRPEIPPNQPIPPSSSIPTVPTSSGSLVTVGEFFYLYYSDLSPDGTCAGLTSSLRNVPCIAVARAKIADVIAAAAGGRIAPWRKYCNGAFSEPGIGGRFSPLIVTTGATWARWPAVSFDAMHGRFLMTDVLVESGPLLRTAVELRESRDGLRWSAPIRLVTATAPQEFNYPSIVPVGGAGPCEAVDVLVVRELDSAQLGRPYTREVDAVRVR